MVPYINQTNINTTALPALVAARCTHTPSTSSSNSSSSSSSCFVKSLCKLMAVTPLWCDHSNENNTKNALRIWTQYWLVNEGCKCHASRISEMKWNEITRTDGFEGFNSSLFGGSVFSLCCSTSTLSSSSSSSSSSSDSSSSSEDPSSSSPTSCCSSFCSSSSPEETSSSLLVYSSSD